MSTRVLWAAVVVAFAVAGVLAYQRRTDSSEATASVEDAVGDAVGAGGAPQKASADLVRATVRRDSERVVARFVLATPVEASANAADGEAIRFRMRLVVGSTTYTLRARVAEGRDEADLIDSTQPGRPIVLESPVVDGSTVEVKAPRSLLAKLAGPFTWGAIVDVDGAQDKAPNDLAGVFAG